MELMESEISDFYKKQLIQLHFILKIRFRNKNIRTFAIAVTISFRATVIARFLPFVKNSIV